MQAKILSCADRLANEEPRLRQAIERGEETRQECEALDMRELC